MNRSKYDLTHRNMFFMIAYLLLAIIALITIIILKTSSTETKISVIVLPLFVMLYVYVYDYLRIRIEHIKKYMGSISNPQACSNMGEITKQSPMFYSIVAGISFIIISLSVLIIKSGMCSKYLSPTDNPMECNILIILISLNLIVLTVYVSMNLTNIGELHNELKNLAKQKKKTLEPNRNRYNSFMLICAFISIVFVCLKTMTAYPLLIQLSVKSIFSLSVIATIFVIFINYNISYVNSNLYDITNSELK
jgi:hypothetical protein